MDKVQKHNSFSRCESTHVINRWPLQLPVRIEVSMRNICVGPYTEADGISPHRNAITSIFRVFSQTEAAAMCFCESEAGIFPS